MKKRIPPSIQRLINGNYAYPWLSQCAEKRYSPPLKIVIMDIKNGQGGEGLILVHWLSYEKLDLCMLCAYTADVLLQLISDNFSR